MIIFFYFLIIFSIIQFDINQRVLGHIGLLNGFPPHQGRKIRHQKRNRAVMLGYVGA